MVRDAHSSWDLSTDGLAVALSSVCQWASSKGQSRNSGLHVLGISWICSNLRGKIKKKKSTVPTGIFKRERDDLWRKTPSSTDSPPSQSLGRCPWELKNSSWSCSLILFLKFTDWFLFVFVVVACLQSPLWRWKRVNAPYTQASFRTFSISGFKPEDLPPFYFCPYKKTAAIFKTPFFSDSSAVFFMSQI